MVYFPKAGFPWWLSGKESAWNAGDAEEVWQTWVHSLGGENLLEEELAMHSVSLSGKWHGQRGLVGYRPWGHQEMDTTEHAIIYIWPFINMHFKSQITFLLNNKMYSSSFSFCKFYWSMCHPWPTLHPWKRSFCLKSFILCHTFQNFYILSSLTSQMWLFPLV